MDGTNARYSDLLRVELILKKGMSSRNTLFLFRIFMNIIEEFLICFNGLISVTSNIGSCHCFKNDLFITIVYQIKTIFISNVAQAKKSVARQVNKIKASTFSLIETLDALADDIVLKLNVVLTEHCTSRKYQLILHSKT